MPSPITEEEAAVRQTRILTAARWCFLNFGFGKTTLEDIARRADLSRTLLYRAFRDKEEMFQAVFAGWILSRQPAAGRLAAGPGKPLDRLMAVCRLMALEPWEEMAGAPMAGEYFDVCARISPENQALYRGHLHACVSTILGDAESATVFLLALDGLFSDHPSPAVLEPRVRLLAERFSPPTQRKKRP